MRIIKQLSAYIHSGKTVTDLEVPLYQYAHSLKPGETTLTQEMLKQHFIDGHPAVAVNPGFNIFEIYQVLLPEIKQQWNKLNQDRDSSILESNRCCFQQEEQKLIVGEGNTSPIKALEQVPDFFREFLNSIKFSCPQENNSWSFANPFGGKPKTKKPSFVPNLKIHLLDKPGKEIRFIEPHTDGVALTVVPPSVIINKSGSIMPKQSLTLINQAGDESPAWQGELDNCYFLLTPQDYHSDLFGKTSIKPTAHYSYYNLPESLSQDYIRIFLALGLEAKYI